MKPNISMQRGDTKKIVVQLLDENGAPLPTAQVSAMFFTVKNKRGDADVSAIISKSLGSGIVITNTLTGMITVTISPSDTSSLTEGKRGLPWDVQIIKVNGEVYTVLNGLLNIAADVTRRIV